MRSLDILEPKQRLQTLKEMLHQHSAPAAEALVQREADGAVRCFACGHRCLVKPGRDGVCRVRFNENGQLLVPHGYVGCLACDPIEKKPFFHVLPGSDALTFGMLGCDYHCGYCFPGETLVTTERGPLALADAFASAQRKVKTDDAEIALPAGLRVVAASGALRKVRAVFRHPYRGALAVIKARYLPELRCTPDHRIYATDDPAKPPAPIQSRQLTVSHYLAIPRSVEASSGVREIDVREQLAGQEVTHRVRWKLSPADRQFVLNATAAGEHSAHIGAALGKSASYIRHVRSKLARSSEVECRTGGILAEEGRVRFPHERRPGLPDRVTLDENFATLLGYYCAEGCVVRSRSRPNSHVLNFSFGHHEADKAQLVSDLLRRCMGVRPRLVRRATTLAVAVGKASAALLFKSLAGARGAGKRVPQPLFEAPEPVVRAFLDAYVRGDGHCYANGKTSVTTVSRPLAFGVAQLLLRLGCFPSVYAQAMDGEAVVQGRRVRRCAQQYSVVWYQRPPAVRDLHVTEDFYLVPVREVRSEPYDGDVYNMEVEQEHNYLAGLLLVSNCQNWVTSQMLRDPEAVAPPKVTTPRELVDHAIRHGAPVVASSYNEPLITSEWAVDIFKEAKGRGLRCAYISNGNGTPQVLDFIRPYVDAYKVDLKTFNPRHYRQLGGVMENVTETIRMLKERGFWVEIVTLVVPGFSDDADELKRMADFLASVDPLMPWHMTAFHPDYKMTDGYRSTTADDLLRIVEYGTQAGLKYLYPGNLPGQVGEWENTRCHHCNATVIQRFGFYVLQNRIASDGLCPDCREPLPGLWGKSSGHGDGRVRGIL